MPDRAADDLDCAIIALAAHAHDLAERDLDLPGNTEQLRSAVLAILRNLDEREQPMAARPIAI